MNLILYKINSAIIAQYLLILGIILILKFKTTKNFDKYDPHVILFLYYLGIVSYNFKVIKQ